MCHQAMHKLYKEEGMSNLKLIYGNSSKIGVFVSFNLEQICNLWIPSKINATLIVLVFTIHSRGRIALKKY